MQQQGCQQPHLVGLRGDLLGVAPLRFALLPPLPCVLFQGSAAHCVTA